MQHDNSPNLFQPFPLGPEGGRILAIDYGLKRTGIAVTDPLKLIATALTTVETPKLMVFLKTYISKEPVERIVIGMPLNLDDTPTHATPVVQRFITVLHKYFPAIAVTEFDERFTSKTAAQALLDMGMKQKQRRQKGNLDQVAAAIMLQEYLNSR